MEKQKYQFYLNLLEKEMVPALGCTEPIAVAYAAAKAVEVLGDFPDSINVKASGNLEVLDRITEEDLKKTKKLLEQNICSEGLLETSEKLHILVSIKKGQHSAQVEIKRTHLGIVSIKKDGSTIFETSFEKEADDSNSLDFLSVDVESIYNFSNEVSLEEVALFIERQIILNSTIAKEGILNDYGANIGASLLELYGNDVKVRAKAMPAAGSDARMSGCELPVIINSGSG